jgi:hypothetical protein
MGVFVIYAVMIALLLSLPDGLRGWKIRRS